MTAASSTLPSSNLFSTSFIRQVSKLLTAGSTEVLATISFPGAVDLDSKVGIFLDLLCARAPAEFIRRKTPSRVATIINCLLEVVSKQRDETSKIAIKLERVENSAAIFVALDDHPFIVSSIAECLHEAEIHLECFQHPIISVRGSPLAVSYIEIAERDCPKIEPAVGRIHESLKALRQIVADHNQMSRETREYNFGSVSSIVTDSSEISTAEASTFLSWLASGSFFFLGTSRWTSDLTKIDECGVWRLTGTFQDSLQAEVRDDIRANSSRKIRLSIHKLRSSSLAHRRATILHIVISGVTSSDPTFSIVGYLTSKAWAYEAQDIPVLRVKLAQVLALEKTPPNSHDYKYVEEVIDNMPTDEALTLPIAELRALAQLALGVFSREDSRSYTYVDSLGRRALTLVVLPPGRYSARLRDTLQSLIEKHLEARPKSSDIHIDSSKKRQLRLYVSTPLSGALVNRDHDALNRAIQRASVSWNDSFIEARDERYPEDTTDPVTFSDDYQIAISRPEALADYGLARSLSTTRHLAVALFVSDTTPDSPTLTFISAKSSISISRAVPVLENIRLEVLDANSYTIRFKGADLHVLKCEVRSYDGERLTSEEFNTSVSPGLEQILVGVALDDPLNVLLRRIPVSVEQIQLLRAYCAFLWQTHKASTKRTMWKAVAGAPEVARQLLRYFDRAFNPQLSLSVEQRRAQCLTIETDILIALRGVTDITHDRILKGLSSLVKHTVRANFYTGHPTIALKVASQKVEFMPHPRPLFEVFVFSPRIEGTHLRSSKVSRGGIRWSERLDDYRAEILGLMKTQKVKNVIIVPSGAKGGFIVKNLPQKAELIPKAVEEGYREYITALLTLADNKVGDAVASPPDCVIHDEPDPYFVVAADKGTATFSDVANSIAQSRFNYWLGDAFASGGSAGYDHKKYGITARGGWECVTRHFKDLGIDPTRPFSTVGIGDMSGDVFGNAMILSSSIALVAAFNHKHIFVDPSPDTLLAFEERKRLFALPRSQWSDFNPDSISAGGGVFGRFEKEIHVTPQMRTTFGLSDDTPASVDGETLISLILKAPVDLLWNGGIGTYVKARTESQSDVNDGANDGVRVNADEIRARVVGEGGNLGFTQKARIEFSSKGGRINTDAIDNSGGVDLSDHEVNLKLLLSPLVASGTITIERRNSLLQEISSDVVDSVLQHNRDQSLMLSIAAARSALNLDQYRHLIREMHRGGFLDRGRDGLPDELELDQRASNRTGMTRPELAICSAATKMWLKEGLRNAKLLSDPMLEQFLLNYFPSRVQTDFRKEVLSHALRDDIISNEIVAECVPAVGMPFLPSVVFSGNASVADAIKCVLAADSILATGPLRRRLHEVDTVGNWDNFSALWVDTGIALRRASAWLLQTHSGDLSLGDMIRLYRGTFATLTNHSQLVFTGAELRRFDARVVDYEKRGASSTDATLLSLYRRVNMILEVLWCAREYDQDVREVARSVSRCLETLKINSLFRFENALESSNKWEQELVTGAYQEIRRSISVIIGRVLSTSDCSENALNARLAATSHKDAIISTIAEVEENNRLRKPFQISVLPVVARQLRLLAGQL
jgi:glutamate dehydrogenase